VPQSHDSIFNSDEEGSQSPSLSDVLFQNESAMWCAEFDGLGEEAVRSNVENNYYTPTGMEVARQWLARRGSPQLRGDLESIRALADSAHRTAADILKIELEESTIASRVDANSRAIVEIAANSKKNARAAIFIGVITSLFSLCAIIIVLASSQHVASTAKRTSAQPPRSKQALLRTPLSAVPLATIKQTSVIPPENAQNKVPSTKQEPVQAARSKQVSLRPLPAAVPLATVRQASVIPPKNTQYKQPSNTKLVPAYASSPEQVRVPRSPSTVPPAET
jgi:hypothetical protein